MKPVALKPMRRLVHRVPNLPADEMTVLKVWDDIDLCASVGSPQLARVYVDVVVPLRGRWDSGNLPAGTGAESFEFLGGIAAESVRYRLVFLPDTDVEVRPDAAG